MSNIAPVSGVGKNAKRTDLGRVQKIQRNAKIQNAAGGPRGERRALTELSQGGMTAQTASAVSADQTQQAMPGSSRVTPIFAPGSASRPFTDGAGGNTPGKQPEDLLVNMNTPNSASVLARAMHLANPTPYTRRLVEQFDAAGLF